MKVKDCMCTNVYCATPDTSVVNIAKIMNDKHVGCVPVCNNKNLCGIITDRDIILRTIACNKDVNTTHASEIMTTKVCTCMKEDELENAQTKMETNQIRRLPVCDTNNNVIGMITLGNLAQNKESIGSNKVGTTIGNICKCGNQTKNAE